MTGGVYLGVTGGVYPGISRCIPGILGVYTGILGGCIRGILGVYIGLYLGVYTGLYPRWCIQGYTLGGVYLSICTWVCTTLYTLGMYPLPHPGYTTVHYRTLVYRSSCPVCGTVYGDEALGSVREKPVGMRRREP